MVYTPTCPINFERAFVYIFCFTHLSCHTLVSAFCEAVNFIFWIFAATMSNDWVPMEQFPEQFFPEQAFSEQHFAEQPYAEQPFYDLETPNIYIDDDARSTAPIAPENFSTLSEWQPLPPAEVHESQLFEKALFHPDRQSAGPQKENTTDTSFRHPQKHQQKENVRTPKPKTPQKRNPTSSMPPPPFLPPPASILPSQRPIGPIPKKRGRKRKAPEDPNLSPAPAPASTPAPKRSRPAPPPAPKRPRPAPPPPPPRSPPITDAQTRRVLDHVTRHQLVDLIHQQAHYIAMLQKKTPEDARRNLLEEAASMLADKGGEEAVKRFMDQGAVGRLVGRE